MIAPEPHAALGGRVNEYGITLLASYKGVEFERKRKNLQNCMKLEAAVARAKKWIDLVHSQIGACR